MHSREPSAEQPADARPPESAPARPRGLRWALRVADPVSLAALFIFLLNQSWLRWMDPLIDFPRSLYVAWRLNEGDLLYDQVVSWYGPLPHLVEAAAFRLFGVGLDTMVWLNIAITAFVLLLLRAIFGALGNRLTAWLGVVVFLCVFAFGNYTLIANCNFIAPYASQATYGFAGLLVVLWALLRHLKSARPLWLGVAGLGFGITYLDKPEPLLAAAGSLGIYFFVSFLRQARSPSPASDRRGAGRWAVRALGWLAGGFLCAWLPVTLFFFCRGGLAYALHAADYVPATMLNSSFRAVIKNSSYMQNLFGFNQPWANFLSELGAGAVLLALSALLAAAARDWNRRPFLGDGKWAGVVVVAAAAALAWLGWQAGIFVDAGRAFVVPVCLAALAYALRSGWLAWRGGGGEAARPLGLAVVGTAAALMQARIILNAQFGHFGFFMMPLAVLFWIHVMMVEAARPAPGSRRANWLLPAVLSIMLLFAAGTLVRFNLSRYALKTLLVGEGRDQFYTYDPLRPVLKNGQLLDSRNYSFGGDYKHLIEAFKLKTPNAKTLVVFPEGVAINYALRVRCPLAEQEFTPVTLPFAGPQHVLDELQAHPPEVVMIYDRDLDEYGIKAFGQDENSGRDIMLWLNQHYEVIGHAAADAHSLTGHMIDMLVPNGTPGQTAMGMPLLPNAK